MTRIVSDMSDVGIIGGVGKIGTSAYHRMLAGVSSHIDFLNISRQDVESCLKNDQPFSILIDRDVKEFKDVGIDKVTIACFTLHSLTENICEINGVKFLSALDSIDMNEEPVGFIGTINARDYFAPKFPNMVKLSPHTSDLLSHRIFKRLAWEEFGTEDHNLLIDVIDELESKGAKKFAIGCTDLQTIIRNIVPNECVDLPAAHDASIALTVQ